jgi:hypothetical protein
MVLRCCRAPKQVNIRIMSFSFRLCAKWRSVAPMCSCCALWVCLKASMTTAMFCSALFPRPGLFKKHDDVFFFLLSLWKLRPQPYNVLLRLHRYKFIAVPCMSLFLHSISCDLYTKRKQQAFRYVSPASESLVPEINTRMGSKICVETSRSNLLPNQKPFWYLPWTRVTWNLEYSLWCFASSWVLLVIAYSIKSNGAEDDVCRVEPVRSTYSTIEIPRVFSPWARVTKILKTSRTCFVPALPC